MAGKSSIIDNWAPNSPATRYNVSGKNREFYTFENAPGIGAYATGGTIIDGGDGYIYHIFTGTGTFTVNRPSAAIDSVDYLIVAGGGGSPPGSVSGGGGGGGLLFGNVAVTQSSYPISVGGGGSNLPGAPSSPSINNGSPSTVFGLTATGGGGSGQPSTTLALRAGAPGGSGGGGAPGPTTPSPGPGGSGNTPATIPRQGYPGGSAPLTTGTGGAGGGGAGGSGNVGTTPPATGGLGGPGRIVPEFPSTIVRQAISAPLLPTWEPLVGPGGYAAGGEGSPRPSTRSTPANSGYGGAPAASGVSGGSGIVCIRYKKTAPYSRATGGTIEPSTHPEHPGVWRHIFTSPGTFEVTDPTLQWIDYLAVGGGGGGGRAKALPIPSVAQGSGGGGGAGGFVSSIHNSTTTPLVIPEAYPWNPGYSVRVGEQYPVGVGTYPIGIGTGGVGVGTESLGPGTNGSSTTIGAPGPNQIIAYGGGGGAGNQPPGPFVGLPGASGGGATKNNSPEVSSAGGTATPTPAIQGNNGGASPAPFSTYLACGGGGGGASAVGTVGPPPGATSGGTAGVGGAGWYSVLSPSAYGTPGPLTPTLIYRYFAGGGGAGGASYPAGPYAPGGAGGEGGGGDGGGRTSSGSGLSGISGTTNTGGGGGGARISPPGIDNDPFGSIPVAGNGGPGIVIIQYPE